MTHTEFSATVTLLAAYASLMIGLFCVAFGRSWRRSKKETASAAVLPEIREALVDYVSGSKNQAVLRAFATQRRADFSNAILAFQGALSGSTLDLLCGLTIEFSLINDWMDEARSRDVVERRAAFTKLAFMAASEPCRRILGDLLVNAAKDPDPEIRIAVCRGLVHSDDPDVIDFIFEAAISETPLVRTLLAENLRRHATRLVERTIPEALHSEDLKRVIAALEMVLAWERALPLGDMTEFLRHRDRRIRLLALRLAGMSPQSAESRAGVLDALQDPDPDIAEIAAVSAGRMVLLDAMPSLARLLRVGPAKVARAAAAALAEMPPRGLQALEELRMSSNSFTAAAAGEALARLRREVNV
jgi:HEAT repeat protein